MITLLADYSDSITNPTAPIRSVPAIGSIIVCKQPEREAKQDRLSENGLAECVNLSIDLEDTRVVEAVSCNTASGRAALEVIFDSRRDTKRGTLDLLNALPTSDRTDALLKQRVAQFQAYIRNRIERLLNNADAQRTAMTPTLFCITDSDIVEATLAAVIAPKRQSTSPAILSTFHPGQYWKINVYMPDYTTRPEFRIFHQGNICQISTQGRKALTPEHLLSQ